MHNAFVLTAEDIREFGASPAGLLQIEPVSRISGVGRERSTQFTRSAGLHDDHSAVAAVARSNAHCTLLATASNISSNDAIMDTVFCLWRRFMRTTVTLDDALLDRARRLSGLHERSALLREALAALIQRESANRLARLGGTEGALKLPSRRRSEAKGR
jgi:Arc/MetJ family transcription regulator